MLSSIRRVGFWFLDAAKGGVVRSHYKDIKHHMDNHVPNYNSLNEILMHAVKTTEFYSLCDANDILSFPVINKNIIRENYSKIFSSAYIGKPLHTVSTSGSTGTPFSLEWDIGKRKRQLADLIYFNEKAGHKLGEPYMYFRVWTSKNNKSRLGRLIHNVTPIDIRNLDDTTFETIRARLKRGREKTCIGYASTYEFLAKYLQELGDSPKDFRAKSFITSSEVMTTEVKQMIMDTVGCSIADRYSNEENGFLAQAYGTSEQFEVNCASFYMEILKEDADEPAEIGELGRIVITDLFNHAMPIIRYDTGDLAMKSAEIDGWVTSINSIKGRRADVMYDTSGNKITSHAWGVYMKEFDKLKQYQIVQETAFEYTINLNGAAPHYDDDSILNFLRSILGSSAVIKICHVESIPTLASGKFKRAICNYIYDESNYISE